MTASTRRIICSLLFLSVLPLACTYYAPAREPIWASSEPIAGRSFKMTGGAEGESCQWFFLGFPVSTGGRVHDAFGEATASGADALIGVTIDTKSTVYPFFLRNCAMVEGQAIRFE